MRVSVQKVNAGLRGALLPAIIAQDSRDKVVRMRFSLCTDALWPGLSCEQAAVKAAGLGAGAIEFWAWWDKDLPAIRAACDAEGLEVATICTHFISLVDDAQRAAYLEGLKATLDAAEALRCRYILTQVGNALPGLSRAVQQQHLVDGLREAALLMEGRPVQLLMEPLNDRKDHRGYYLTSSREARDVLQAVDHPQVRMLFDIYHQAMMGEDVLAEIRASLPFIGHMHAAGMPGRGPLRQGRLDYAALFAAIGDLGYEGWLGMEWMDPAPEEELRYWLSQQDEQYRR